MSASDVPDRVDLNVCAAYGGHDSLDGTAESLESPTGSPILCDGFGAYLSIYSRAGRYGVGNVHFETRAHVTNGDDIYRPAVAGIDHGRTLW